MYHPTLDAFNVSLSQAGQQTYGLLELPASQSGDEVPTHVEQTVQITDVDAFTQYNLALLTSEIFTPRINGSTWLHEGSLPATYVNFDKSISMKGKPHYPPLQNNGRIPIVLLMLYLPPIRYSLQKLLANPLNHSGLNSFKGFNITTFKVQNPALPDGTNALGTVLIPNPSVLTITFGNVTFDNYVDGKLIGNSTLQNLVVKPGNNTVPLRGITDQLAVLGLIQGKYKDGKLPVEIVGRTATYNGERLPYYELGLQKNVQHVTLDVVAALGGGK